MWFGGMRDACNSGVKFRVGNGICPVRTHAKLLSDGGCKNDDEAIAPNLWLLLQPGTVEAMYLPDPYLDRNPYLNSCRVLPLWVCCPMRRGERYEKREASCTELRLKGLTSRPRRRKRMKGRGRERDGQTRYFVKSTGSGYVTRSGKRKWVCFCGVSYARPRTIWNKERHCCCLRVKYA